jgi:UMF1 family MFS transporter
VKLLNFSLPPPYRRRIILAWASYDWANSAFSTIVTTFIFAAYFTQKIAFNPILGTKQWGDTIAFSGLIIVLLSPIFGAIADHGGRRKLWLAVFTAFTFIGSALLWFAYPNHHSISLVLICLIIGTVGNEISQVFYNAFITTLAPPQYFGRISGWGWGSGYAGGLIALAITLIFFINAEPSWLHIAQASQVRICGPFAALWLLIFSIPLFVMVPDKIKTRLNVKDSVKLGMQTLKQTLKTLPAQRNLMRFLIARMIYTDGLNTVFAFGGIYAAGTFGLNLPQVIQFGIAMNVAAGIGAGLLAWVDDWIGPKKTILISLFGLTILGGGIVMAKTKILFIIFAFFLCLFVGPVQAASRSLLARIVPEEKITEMFGLYSLTGKATAFIGPWLLGMITYTFSSQRAGIATVLIFFVIGAILLWPVRDN